MPHEDKTTHGAPPMGVYCLANDVVMEWFQGFVRSFRKTNPELPLTVIPYNGAFHQLQSLQNHFHFEIMDEARCAKFDELSLRVMGPDSATGMFRKLACFFGPYEIFIFLDSDIVVTTPLARVLENFSRSDYDFVYFDSDMDMVYTPTLAARMMAAYGSHGFNTGAFASRKGVIREENLLPLADKAAEVRDGLVASTNDQPFFNFIMDVSGRRLTRIDTLLPEMAPTVWARQPFSYDLREGAARTPAGKLLHFIHWAGCAYPTMVRKEIFLRYRTMGMTRWERQKYKREFYYRRFRNKLKQRLLKYKPTARLFELHAKWKRSRPG